MRNYVPIPEFTSVSFTNGKVDHGRQYFTLVLVIFLNVVTGFDIHLHVYGAISSALCHCFKTMWDVRIYPYRGPHKLT